MLELDLSLGASEATHGSGLLGGFELTFADLVGALEASLDNDAPRGLFVRLGGEGRNFAQTEELGRLLARFKADRPVVCHANGLGNASLWLALTGCTRLWLSPAASVDAVGIAGQVMYFKGLLDRLKVRADFLHFGEYKSAVESITHEGPSEAAQESLLALLRSMRSSWMDGLGRARSLPNLAAVEDGPWHAEAARELGLVDAVGYESEARDDLKSRAQAEHFQSIFDDGKRRVAARELGRVLRRLAGAREVARERIAVLPIEGAITLESSGALSESGIVANALSKTLRELMHDDSVKAVVLRIDSPGGSALASDVLWHDLVELGRAKTLVVSVGSMAASGGYYLASAGASIFAEQTSLLGSIGVFGGKLTIDETLTTVGVNGATFPASGSPDASSRAAYLSPLVPWDEPTRERVRQGMSRIYDLFVDRVSTGRGLPRQDVERLATGRVWTGEQAIKLKLVDEIGGLSDAIERARSLGGLPSATPIEVESGAEPWWEMLFGEDSEDSEFGRALARAVEPTVSRRMIGQAEPFLTTLEPLLTGEQALLALPFALRIR